MSPSNNPEWFQFTPKVEMPAHWQWEWPSRDVGTSLSYAQPTARKAGGLERCNRTTNTFSKHCRDDTFITFRYTPIVSSLPGGRWVFSHCGSGNCWLHRIEGSEDVSEALTHPLNMHCLLSCFWWTTNWKIKIICAQKELQRDKMFQASVSSGVFFQSIVLEEIWAVSWKR